MYSKLFQIAAAAVCAAPLMATAQVSGVKFGGHIQTEYSSIDIDQAAGGAGAYRQEAIADNAFFSRWNISVTEDLGNGLSVIAFVDFGLNTGAGVTEIAREQWIGLSSKTFGTFNFGSVHAPLKDFAGGVRVDRFIATSLQLRGSGGAQYTPNNGFGSAAFVDHAIRYTSPVWNALQFAALIAPSDASQADATSVAAGRNGNTGGKGNGIDYQLAAKYKIGLGDIFAGYSRDQASDAQRAAAPVNGKVADDETVWRIGADLKFGAFNVYGQYDRISNALAFNSGGATCGGGGAANGVGDANVTTAQCNTALNTNGDGKIWNLGVSYPIGNTLLVLQGGQTTADAEGLANERTAKNITVGAIHSLSKRTRVYGGYQNVSIDGAHTVSQIGGTSTTSGAILATQPDRSTWVVGMRHSF